jgi:hypothetical protein
VKISFYKIIWFFFSIFVSVLTCAYAYIHPEKLYILVDLLATIFSILVGIFLAISAVIYSRPKISESKFPNKEERTRIEEIINKDDKKIIAGHNSLFWLYYFTLMMAIIFKLICPVPASSSLPVSYDITVKSIAAVFAFVSAMALLWSATLPHLLKSISAQRKDLG